MRQWAPIRRKALILALLVAVVTIPATTAQTADQPKGAITRFATVPSPGSPEPVLIAPDGSVFTATLNAESGDTDAPSKVFHFDKSGKLLREYTIKGQDLSKEHGLTGMAMDDQGRLYIGNLAPPSVIRLDPKTGEESVYAQLRDVPTCSATQTTDCSKAMRDLQPWPDYIVFTADGTMYETDSLQALIWRIPKGGGKGEVWWSDERVQSLTGPPGFGPSAMKLMPDGTTLMFSSVEGPTGDGDPTAGRLWKLPIRPDGKPGTLQQFYVAQSADAPGGIAFAKSGNLYVNLTGSSQIAQLTPDGREVARFPDPLANQASQPPLDGPIDVAFHGDSLLVANSAYVSNTPENWALLDVFVGEPGIDTALHPSIPGPETFRELALRVRPKVVRAAKRTRMHFRVTTTTGDVVAGARVRVGRKRATTNRNGRASFAVVVRRRGRHSATARKPGYRPTHATFRAR
jgi:streptogramin lyase